MVRKRFKPLAIAASGDDVTCSRHTSILTSLTPPPGSRRERTVVVNTLVVSRTHPEPSYSIIPHQHPRSIAHHVLNENRLVIGLHRDVALIWSLQKRVHWAGCAGL